MFANKDNSYSTSSVYCVYSSQYGTKIEFISMGETQMVRERGAVVNWAALGVATAPELTKFHLTQYTVNF